MHQAFTAKCQLGPFFNWLGFLVQFISLVFYVYYTQACRLQAFCRQYYAYLHYAVLAPRSRYYTMFFRSRRVIAAPRIVVYVVGWEWKWKQMRNDV